MFCEENPGHFNTQQQKAPNLASLDGNTAAATKYLREKNGKEKFAEKASKKYRHLEIKWHWRPNWRLLYFFFGEQKNLQSKTTEFFPWFFLVAITAQDAAEMDGHRNRWRSRQQPGFTTRCYRTRYGWVITYNLPGWWFNPSEKY